MPYKTVKQPILPYFQIYIHFMKPFEEIIGIISFVIPGITAKQKDNKVMPDHQENAWGTGKI